MDSAKIMEGMDSAMSNMQRMQQGGDMNDSN